MKYIERVLEDVKAKNTDQPEFIQAVEEVLESLEPVIEAHPEYFGTAVKHLTNMDDHTVNGTTADSFVAGMVLTVEFYYYAVNDNSLVYLMMGAGNPTIQDVKTELFL